VKKFGDHSEWCLPLGAGLVAAVICRMMLTPGITVEPDGWAYWEGSVSILQGKGYRFFGGQPITDFPPLFSLFLSMVQSISGISGWSLAGSLVALAGIAACLWSALLVSLARTAPNPFLARLVGALYVAAYIGAYYTSLLSETLFLALLPLLYFCVTRIRTEVPVRGVWFWTGAASLAAGALSLTRNSAIVFIPGLVLVVFLRTRPLTLFRCLSLAALSGGLASAIWCLTRAFLGQTASHPLGMGNRYSPAEYAQQFAQDLAYRLGPAHWHLGAALLVITVLSIVVMLARHSAASALRDVLHMLLVAATAALGLFVLFNVIPMVADTLSGRFIWYLPLTLVTALATVAAYAVTPAARNALLVILAAIFSIQANRTGAHLALRLRAPPQPNVRMNYTINPDFLGKPPESIGSWVFVSPPDYFWIDRSFATRDKTRAR
jgi:hypothetical protein